MNDKLIKTDKQFTELAKKILSNRCGFIHIPKTSGSSMFTNLYYSGLLYEDESQHIFIDGLCLAHVPYNYRTDEMKKMYPYNRESTFCIIREPTDRIISMYKHHLRMFPTSRKTLQGFITYLCNSGDQWAYSQYDFAKNADFIVFFEDISKLEKALGWQFEKINVSHNIINFGNNDLSTYREKYSLDYQLYDQLINNTF